MSDFGTFLGWALSIFLIAAYLLILFFILTDLFRDPKLAGGWKAVWVLVLVLFPLLSSLVYLIARGRGMQERAQAEQKKMQELQETYIRNVSTPGDPADQIAKAKQLLDDGVIEQADFDRLKAKALG